MKLTSRSSDGDINDTDFEDVSTVVKFLVDLLMRLTSSPKIPLSAQGNKLISQSEEAISTLPYITSNDPCLMEMYTKANDINDIDSKS